MKIEKIRYKGINFDFFFLYNHRKGYIGGPCEEVNEQDIDSIGLAVCPHCINKYRLYAETDSTPESVAREIAEYGDEKPEDFSATCGVEGCNNGLADDFYIRRADVEMEEI